MKLIVEEVEEKINEESRAVEIAPSNAKPALTMQFPHFNLNTRRKKIFLIIFAFIIFESLFLLPLFASTGFFIKSGSLVADQKIEEAKTYHEFGNSFLSISKALYLISRPALSFFYLARFPDNLISLHDDIAIFIDNAINASKSLKIVSEAIFSTQTESSSLQIVPPELEKLKFQVNTLAKHSRRIEQKLDSTLPFLDNAHEKVDSIAGFMEDEAEIIEHLESILGKGKKAQYIVFFYNNMELRPGGGFIGSFALLTFDKYSLSEFTVFDVYDADGQLKNHVKPPQPISQYLHQPHYYLRDSNFTPDFPENVKTAEYFLERELGITNIDGAIGLTTTGLSYILEAFEPIFIPDLNENITKDNFYLKTQSGAEAEFFPGSKKKKNYLSSLSQQMILSINKADQGKLSLSILQALQEKQLIIFSKNDQVEKSLSVLRWGGSLVTPVCVQAEVKCQLNHIFPVDANLGVNKANAFISRLIKQSISIDSTGQVRSKISVIFNNKSPGEVYPGGDYLNYFQIYLPSDAHDMTLVVDGKVKPEFDIKRSGNFQVVGIPITIPALKQGIIEIEYIEGGTISTGKSIYQLLVQKQIGLINTDFALQISLPSNIHVIDTNFTRLAKGNRIIYNTVLSSDKLFLIELERNSQ